MFSGIFFLDLYYCSFINKILLSMHLENHFKHITTLFYSGDYQEGQKELSQMIKVSSSDPILYANRALFNSQLKNDEQAIKDLQKAIDMQPMNYISYFNLFSILVKMKEDKLAIRNINCSLSVMYTLRGRHRKSMEDAQRAIQLAYNNIQARVLKGLLLLDKGLYQQSKKQFQKTLNIAPGHYIIQELLSITIQKLDPESTFSLDTCTNISGPRRLLSQTVFPDDSVLNDEINKKVDEFNNLYNELNNQIGGVTQKVPKEQSIYLQGDANIIAKNKEDRDFDNSSAIGSLKEEKFDMSQKADQQKQTQVLPLEELTQKQQSQFKEDNNYVPKGYSGLKVAEDELQDKERVSFSQTSQGIDEPKHPLTNTHLISITVLNFDFFESEQFQHLQQIYAILSYNNSRDKLITKPVPCDGGLCSWNKTFSGIPASKEPAPLKIKLYNKQRNEIRDFFLGEFQVLLNTADLLKIPLEDRKGVAIGDLLVQVSQDTDEIQ